MSSALLNSMEAKTLSAPEPPPIGDETLMAQIQEREPEALAALYDRYSGILKSLIMGVIHNDAEADDLLQEIFMEIWNQAAHYSAQKGQTPGLDRHADPPPVHRPAPQKAGVRPRGRAAPERDRAAAGSLGA